MQRASKLTGGTLTVARHAWFLGLVLVISTGIAGCSQTTAPAQAHLMMAAMAELPEKVQQAPVAVREAYQFAAANPETLKEIPCYCGCNQFGHRSNYDCYIAGQAAEGDLMFDDHALLCTICVDITQDTMRLLREGVSTAGIRTYVDTTYARYGPSNMPPAR